MTSTWQAHDDVLDRRVFLRVVSKQHPHCNAVLDAARQAASVEDPRLTRILDVGESEGSVYVVNEWLDGPSLAEELLDGPLSAEDARTVVGEVALALEAARHRGLHHLRLTPSQVHRLDDGGVRVTELAIAAALSGLDLGPTGMPAEVATVVDARDLVALVYAALTGSWPLTREEGSYDELPQAPRISGRPASPAQLVSGAPADLDTLCSQAFSGAGAPDSPGELARQIAPWGRERRESGLTQAWPSVPPPTGSPTPVPPTTPAQTSMMPVVPGTSEVRADPAYLSAAYPPAGSAAAPIDPAGPFGRPADPAQQGRPAVDHRSQWRGQWGGADNAAPNPATASPRQTRTVIMLVGGFIAVFLLLAYFGLRGLGDNNFVSRNRASSPATETAPPSPSPTPSGSTSAPGTGQSIPISAGRGFDPEGDGSEKDGDAAEAFDNDPASSWTSDTYNSVAFGGLKKGVGLYLDLNGPQNVTSVKVSGVASGTTFELRTADGERLSSTALATASATGGDVELTPAASVETDNIVLWFTTPAAVDGGYRVEVAEVEVS
jgi:eukaryotic-like serine/threonine-protein kinase